jgi:hypothetical protein
MDANAALNLLALAISVLALATSSVLVLRQTGVQQRSNYVTYWTQVSETYRDRRFHLDSQFI